jgi:hypothetical protein
MAPAIIRRASAKSKPCVTAPGKSRASAKSVPLGSEKRLLKFQVQAYNALNHPEFNAMNTGIRSIPRLTLCSTLPPSAFPLAHCRPV